MEIGDIKARSAERALGEWSDRLPGLPGVRLRARPITHPAYVAALSRAARQAPDSDREPDGRLTAEGDAKVELYAIATGALTGWEGITLDGQDVPFSPETALELVQHHLFEAAVRTAMGRAFSRQHKADENLVGNLSTPSSGS